MFEFNSNSDTQTWVIFKIFQKIKIIKKMMLKMNLKKEENIKDFY